MKSKILRMMGVPLTLAILVSLLFVAVPVSANPGANTWETQTLPAATAAGGYKLATGATNVGPMAIAKDGALYAYANPALVFGLFKSADGGNTWTKLTTPAAAVVAIVPSIDDANVVYYATAAAVFKSINAGTTWATVVNAPAGQAITSLDIRLLAGRYMVAVGTAAVNAADVYIMDEGVAFPTLTSMGFNAAFPTADTIIDVGLVPDFYTSRGIAAVGYDAGTTTVLISTRIGGGAWGGNIGNPAAIVATATAGAIAFASDWSSDPATGRVNMYVGINDAVAANQGLHYIQGVAAPAASFRANIRAAQIGSVAVAGPSTSAQIMVGLSAAAGVHYSTNSGATWTVSAKPPTGTLALTYVVMANDFATSNKAWAACGGNEGGVSVTTNGGAGWNQIGLVITAITVLNDLAIPSGSVLYMASDDIVDDSLWKYDGTTWTRVLSSTQILAAFDTVETSPTDANYVFVANVGNQWVYRSTDGGAGSFTVLPNLTLLNVTGMTVINNTTVIVGGLNGTVKTTNGGLSWPATALAGAGNIVSFAAAPGDTTKLLIGTSAGFVYSSTDTGSTWTVRGATLGAANAYVAYDAAFATNNTIYATSAAAGGGVHRFVIGTSTAWTQIDTVVLGAEPLSTIVTGSGIICADDGTLYATDANALVNLGMNRSLSPTSGTATSFELANDTAAGTLGAAVQFRGLWITSKKLWTVDIGVGGPAIYFYTDDLSGAPLIKVGTVTTTSANLSWTLITGATSYQLEINTRSDFNAAGRIGPFFSPIPVSVASATSPVLLAPGTEHWARVRVATAAGAGAPVLSRWSAGVKFATGLAQPGAIININPAPGEQNIVTSPSFGWGAVAGASSYEIEVADNPDFKNSVKGTSPINAWTVPSALKNATTYYWKVTAIGPTGVPASAPVIGVFTTAAAPTTAPPTIPPQVTPTIILPTPTVTVTMTTAPAATITAPPAQVTQITPAWIYAIIAVGAVLVIAVIVLIIRTRRVV